MVDAFKTNCFPLFCRHSPVTKQHVNWCLWEFSLIYFMFTARLTHDIQVVFQCSLVFSSYKTTLSLEFSVRFLAFSQIMNVRKMKTACSSAFTSWLTLKKHGVFLEENRDFVTHTPTFVPFLHLLLLYFYGILRALWKLLGGVVSKFSCSYVFILCEFVAVPLLSQWHSKDLILLTEGLDSLLDYVPRIKYKIQIQEKQFWTSYVSPWIFITKR